MTRGGHTLKFGGEYRNIDSQFQFLGSTEITYAGINEFIDNRPTQVAVALDSPGVHPQQFYAIGFAQDTWRATSRLTLELGLRYDFYSVVKEKDGKARPFFIEENEFGDDPEQLLQPGQEQLRAAAVGGLSAHRQDGAARRLRALLRPRPVRGPHPADRELHRAPARADDRRARQRAGLPGRSATYRNLLSVRGYTHERPDEYNIQYGASVSQELPGAVNLTVGYTGSRGKDMFLRGVANTFDDDDARARRTRPPARWTTRRRAASTA